MWSVPLDDWLLPNIKLGQSDLVCWFYRAQFTFLIYYNGNKICLSFKGFWHPFQYAKWFSLPVPLCLVIAAAIIRNFNFVPEKEILDFVLGKELSVWPTCIWFHSKDLVKTFPVVFELSYVMTKLWCFEFLFHHW